MGKAVTIRDDLGDEIVLERLPERIVSLVPSVTETIVDLGAADRLVGITNYCVHPASVVQKIAKVGGTKGFHFDRIEALRPDLIVANKEENRKHHIDRLRESCPVFVTYPRTVEEAMKTVLDLGTITGSYDRACETAAACDQLLADFNPSLVGPALRTACMVWRDPWMAVGGDTYMHELLERTGFRNVYGDARGRYPETTLEEVGARGAKIVLLPDEPYAFSEKDRTEVSTDLQNAGVRARILLLDGSHLTWFGTRTLRGLRSLMDIRSDIARGAA
jgi:ABC-type Fe3+-hydroxamate transport system substrate-binding protein